MGTAQVTDQVNLDDADESGVGEKGRNERIYVWLVYMVRMNSMEWDGGLVDTKAKSERCAR